MKNAFLGLLAASLVAVACHHRPAEGPAQRAGRSIDDAAQDTKDAAKDTKHDVKRDLNK